VTLLKTFFYSGVTNYLLSIIIKNFFIHDHQQQLHDHQQLHPSSIKNFFIHDHQQQLHDHQQLHPSKTFSFMIINNNNFIHPCQVHTFSLAGPTVWLTQLS